MLRRKQPTSGLWLAVLTATASLLLGPLAERSTAADELADQYFRGLRARRLFSVAEAYCLRRLAEPDLLPGERADLTVELSRTFTEHAAFRVGREQEELWQRARDVVTNLLAREPGNIRRDLLQLQAALVPAAQGEFLAWQAELYPHDAAAAQRATAQLEAARDALQTVEARLAESLRKARAPTDAERADGALQPAERLALADEASYRTAAVGLALARLRPAGVERTAALQDADARLSALVKTRSHDERTWNARLLRIELARLRGEWDQAAALVEATQRLEPPAAWRDRLLAERVRIDLARERPDEALARLAERQRGGGLGDELVTLHVETLLAARDVAQTKGETELARDLWEEAERVAVAAGGAWGARGRARLDAARDADVYGPELSAVMQAARAAYQSGDADAAARHFLQAADLARAGGKAGLASELLLTRGSVLLKAGRLEVAAADFLAASESADDADKSAEAHLLYAYCLGRFWEEQPGPARRDAYAEALAVHRQRFAAHDSVHEAAWMQGALADHEEDWPRAIELYSQVPLDHARGALARARIAALHEQMLDRLRASGQPAGDWEQRAMAQLTAFLDTMPLPPERLSLLEAEVALRLARIILNRPAPDYDDADALLQRIIVSHDIAAREAQRDRAPAIDPSWAAVHAMALQLRIVSLAGQDRLADATQIVEGLTAADPQVLLSVLNGLDEMAAQISPARQRALGELQVRAAERLRTQRGGLDQAAARRLDECLARAYAVTGRPNDALSVYEPLLEQSPRDKRLLRGAAELLGELGSPAQRERAKTYWRRLESLEKTGSVPWLEARYQVAAVTLQLGQSDECRKLIQVTRLLYPELGNEDLRRRFAELELRLNSR